jgi:transposase-like protein
MLKHFGSLSCPRCATSLVHTTEPVSDRALADYEDDQRWHCPTCGYSRPVVYSVERMNRSSASARFSRIVRPLLWRS